jgi:hypothetical protein
MEGCFFLVSVMWGFYKPLAVLKIYFTLFIHDINGKRWDF